MGLHLNGVDGRQYLGAYLGPREQLEGWVRPKVEAWAHGFFTLDKIAKWYPQSTYSCLFMLFHLERQYLKKTVPGVGSMMGPI